MHDDIKGCDEPNLATFPLFLLSDKSAKSGQTALEFEDVVANPLTGDPIRRRLTISCKEAGRLPTERDDVLITGLLALSRRVNGLADPVVSFTRREIMALVDWPQTKQYYKTLHESIHFWRDVKLNFEGAWLDLRTERYHDVAFQFLNDVVTDRSLRRPDVVEGYTISWNRIFLQKLKDGYLHNLDVSLYCRLSPAGKRMYRFLRRGGAGAGPVQCYDLVDFAANHIGVARGKGYDAGQIKRRLRKAFDELAAEGLVEDDPDDVRYRKRARGGWDVHIRLAPGFDAIHLDGPRDADTPTDAIVADPAAVALLRMVEFPGFPGPKGFDEATSVDLATGKDLEYISTWIDEVRRRAAAGKIDRNPFGYLRNAIEKGLPVPRRRDARERQRMLPIEAPPPTKPKSDEEICEDYLRRCDESERKMWYDRARESAPEAFAVAEEAGRARPNLKKAYVARAYVEVLTPLIAEKLRTSREVK